MPTATRSTALAAELRHATMRLRRQLVSQRHPDNDLSIPAMVVLGALFRHGEQTIGALAAFEKVQPPTMTRTVNCLEAEGLVRRRPHDTDGRQVLVCLTDAGRDKVLADRDRRDAWLARRLDALSADERDLLARATGLLQRLTDDD